MTSLVDPTYCTVNVEGLHNELYDFNLKNITVNRLVNSGAYTISIDGFATDNVTCVQGFTLGAGSSLSGLEFDKVNFTDAICYLGNDIIVSDSYFTDCVGGFKVRGDNVNFIRSNFTNCKNNTYQGNGSCIELINGELFFIDYCRFIGNKGYNGAAVYIA